MENIDINGGTLLATYSLPTAVARDLMRHVARAASGGGSARLNLLKKIADWVGLFVFALLLFAVPRLTLDNLDGFNYGLLIGFALVAAPGLVAIVRHLFTYKKLFARVFDKKTISVRLHDLGISWGMPDNFSYIRFKAFDRVSSFNGGLVLHVGLGAVFIPKEFLTAKLNDMTVLDTVRSELPHLNWDGIRVDDDMQ